MSHNVETMMYAGREPWHGLGTKVDELCSVEDAIVAAGLEWDVISRQLYWLDELDHPYEAGNQVAQMRSSDQAILGYSTARYVPLQNREAFNFFQPFLDNGDAHLHTAGSLNGGKTVWVLAKINNADATIGEEDRVDAFVLLSNSHDGTTKVRVGFTPIAVVCNNTLTLAHSKQSGSKLISLKHSANMHKNLEMLRESMDVARQEFRATADLYVQLAESDCSTEDVRKMVQIVFDISDEQVEKGNSTVSQIITNFHTGRGSGMVSRDGTWWGGYNAVTEYISHHYGNDANSRLNANWFGANRGKNQGSLDYAVAQVVGG